MKKTLTIWGGLILLLCNVSFARVLIVNNNSTRPTGHYFSIQDAVTAGNNGDTIYVVGSPDSYGNVSLSNTTKSFVFIGAGYRPQKDFNYASKIGDIDASTIFPDNGDNTKILGFEIFGIVGKNGTSCCGGDGWEIAYNKFTGSGAGIGLGNNSNVHDNYFEVATNGGNYGIIRLHVEGNTNSQIHNNIFSRLAGTLGVLISDGTNGPPFNTTAVQIYNNHFLSASGGNVFGNIYSATISNNLFYGYTIADVNNLPHPQACSFNNNLTNYSFSPFADNTFNSFNIFGLLGSSQFQNPNQGLNGAFDFPPYYYNLIATSVGHNAGTDGKDIGAFGGSNPFNNFTGMQNIPVVKKLDISNSIIGINDPLKIHVQATNRAIADSQFFKINSAEYFFDTDPGQGSGISISLNTSDSVSIDSLISTVHGLALGNHKIGYRVMNTNGVWSHPEMRSFNVCTVSGTTANFFSQISGQNVLFTNTSLFNQTNHWDFGDGDTSIVSAPFHRYQTGGIFNTCLTSYNQCSSDTKCISFSIKGIQSIFPNQVANTGAFIFDIAGVGFDSLVNLTFEKTGQTPIQADSIIHINANTIKVIFNFSSATLGKWDARAWFSNLTTSVLDSALEIESYRPPQLSVNITGDPVLRIGLNEVYHITISNAGNVDAYFPYVDISGLPPGTVFEFLTDSLYGGNSIPSFDTLNINFDSLQTVSHIDPTTNTSFYMIEPYKIPANGEITIDVIFHVPSNTVLHSLYDIRVLARSPMYTSIDPLAIQRTSSSLFECSVAIAKAAFVLASAGSVGNQCLNDVAVASLSTITEIINLSKIKFNSSHGISNSYHGALILWDLIEKNVALAHLVEHCAGDLSQELNPAFHYVSVALAGLEVGPACVPKSVGEYWGEAIYHLIVGNAIDPNQKFGPGGNSEGHFLNDMSEMFYTIQFENYPSASLPAQTIKIVDSLDVSKFDLSTFSFTNANLGLKTVSQTNTQSFFNDIDFSNELGVNARISGQLDTTTGIVTWIINSIDTATNQILTNNAALGILPPDTSSPKGQGSVSFKIKLLPNITNNDTVRNSATIIFDNNAPIITPIWTNIIDNLKPESQVNALPAVSTSDSINIHWTGNDNGPAGVYAYNIYYNINGGSWILWKYNTSETSSIFGGILDSTYGFYSVAIDSALNVETAPTIADATIKIGRPLKDSICAGANSKIASGNSLAGNTYQWQVNAGSGFEDIINNSIYANANGDTLMLTQPPSTFAGYKFRCNIINGNDSYLSPVHELHFINTWTGTVSTSWENSANWSCNSVPDLNTDVMIKNNVPNFPLISSNAYCKSVNVSPNTSLLVKAGFNLFVTGKGQ